MAKGNRKSYAERREAIAHRRHALDTAFVLAAERGMTSIVEELLEAGANLHAYNEQPLLYAAAAGQTKMVQFLLEKGANHQEAMVAAAENNHAETARVIIKWQERHPAP